MESSESGSAKEVLPESAGIHPTLHARKQQFVRDTIWDVATDLFAERGFDETTVDDIAEAAGVSRRSLFRYFSSKSDLMAYGMVSYGADLSDAIGACPDTYSHLEVLRETVLKIAQRSAAHPRTRKIMDIISKYPEARAAEQSRLHEVQDRVAAAFARRDGVPKDGLTAPLLAGMTLQVLGATFRAWFREPGRDISATAEEALAAMRRLVCDGQEIQTGKPGSKRPRR